MAVCAHCMESPAGRGLTVVAGLVYCDKADCLDAASDHTLAAAALGDPVPHYDATAAEVLDALENC